MHYFMTFGICIMCLFGIFYTVLVCCIKNNLATLVRNLRSKKGDQIGRIFAHWVIVNLDSLGED
jgi:succinate-acetate transporter protein